MKRYIAITAALTTLVACGDPQPLSVDRSDVNEALLDIRAASLLEVTPVDDIPSGSATYEGQFTSSAVVNDETGYQVIGDIELSADFGASRTVRVDGEIENINLIDRFNSERQNSQELIGSLDINGNALDGGFIGVAEGDLTAVINNDGFLRDSDVALDLRGEVVTDRDPGDTLFGIIDGEGRGGFDIEILGDGAFSATRD